MPPGGELPLFPPTPSFMVSAEEVGGTATLSFVLSFVPLFGVHLTLLGIAWAEGKGELATCRHRAGSRRDPDKICAAIVCIG